MTITETTKYLIFSCDELKVELKKEAAWYDTYDGTTRRVDETSPNWHNHYREVQHPWSNFDDKNNPQFGKYLRNLSEIFGGTGPVFMEVVKEQIFTNLGDFLGDGVLMRHTYNGGKATNRWGEEKIVLEGDPLDPDKWNLWVDDHKREKEVRQGDKYLYQMKPALAQITRRIVEDDDDANPLNTYHFDRDVLPDDLHLKPNHYLVCDKVYLKENFETMMTLAGLTTLDNGKEVIRVVDNQATIQAIIAQNEITAGTVGTVDNTAIKEYNKQITKKLQDSYNRIFEVQEKTDELIAFFISVERENDPEIDRRVQLIFAPQPLPALKEELTGDAGDVAKQANNQAIETRNPQIIQGWENNFIQKKTTFTELKKMWNEINNPEAPENPLNNPNEPQKPTSPLVENNQKSEENIKNISQTANLAEAQQKAQQEIKDLLDRYGVKISQLSPNLWDQKTNWEAYLNECVTVEQIINSVKNMKAAILQQNQQNNQAKQKLSVTQLQQQSITEIEELLQKYPEVKGENLLKNKNWQEEIKNLTSQQQILALVRQLRESIIQQSKRQKQNNLSTNNLSPNFPIGTVVLLSLGVPVLVGGVFLIRHWKIWQRNIKPKKKKTPEFRKSINPFEKC